MPPTNSVPATRNAKVAQAVSASPAKPKAPGGLAAAIEQSKEHVAPPPDTFWTRYSPNGEFFISPMSSVVIHSLILGFILLGVIGWFNTKDEAEEIEPVLVGDGTPGGGGGNVFGEQNNAPGNLSKKDDVTEEIKNDKTVQPDVPEDDPKVKAPTTPKLDDDPDAVQRIEKAKKQDPTRGVYLKDAVTGVAGKGKGGGGRGGGLGEGIGKGIGDKWGLGPGNKRGRRQQRWEMLFRTDTHADYLRQINALGAYIGFPDQTGQRLMVVKDLSQRPAKWQYEEIISLNRIWWTDDRPESARGIAELLEMKIIPSMFFAFMPESIEKELLRVELDYAKKYGVTKEEDITNTVFAVSFRGGKPTFTVKSQTRK